MIFTLPIRTVSEANSHTHWRLRQRRAKAQRQATAWTLRVPVLAFAHRLVVCECPWCETSSEGNLKRLRGVTASSHIAVTLTRIAPRALDSDNLQGSMKHVRDGVADALGIDDRDLRISWWYAQRRGRPGEYSIEVNIL